MTNDPNKISSGSHPPIHTESLHDAAPVIEHAAKTGFEPSVAHAFVTSVEQGKSRLEGGAQTMRATEKIAYGHRDAAMRITAFDRLLQEVFPRLTEAERAPGMTRLNQQILKGNDIVVHGVDKRMDRLFGFLSADEFWSMHRSLNRLMSRSMTFVSQRSIVDRAEILMAGDGRFSKFLQPVRATHQPATGFKRILGTLGRIGARLIGRRS